MRHVAWFVVLGVGLGVVSSGAGYAQGVVGDVMAGKLINPEVGVFAWYEVTDKATGGKYFLRQAIVGEEAVDKKAGYWVETEIVPMEGFPSVYKMLLTGPANKTENIHKIIVREGASTPRNIPIEAGEDMTKEEGKEKRESKGKEKVATAQGEIEAEHVVITQGGAKTDIWLNEKIRPMGLVRLVSAEGELVLQRYGKGGNDAVSNLVLNAEANTTPKSPEVNVEVSGKAPETAPAEAPGASSAEQDKQGKKANFGKKKGGGK